MLAVINHNPGIAQVNRTDGLPASRGLTVVSSNERSIMLRYNSGIPGFDTVGTVEGGFVRMMLPDHSYTSEPGKPQLPVLTTLIDYDRAKDARIIIRNIISVRKDLKETADYSMIYPSQPGQTKTQDPQEKPFVIDKSAYNSHHALLTDTVIISRIGTMRGKNIGSLQINPVIYNPAGRYVDIISSMNIEIEYSGSSSENNKGSGSVYFDNLFAKELINYDSKNVVPAFSPEPTGMVIVADTSFKKHLKPLIEWKTKKGFRITGIYIGENGIERNFQDIKDSLTYIYNNASYENPAPTYLLLAGGLNYIPASEGTSQLSDLYYAEFDGDGDYIPDMFTGRLPAKDSTELKSMIRKIIDYESFIFGDSIKHFEKAVAVTGYDEGNVVYMNGQVNYAAGYFNSNPYPTDPYVFNHESDESIRNIRYDSLRVLMKEGVGFINYTGHGQSSGWVGTGIYYSFVNQMTNKSRYPLIISNACQTGKFNDPNCLGTNMVRGIDKGALAFIGCTNDSYWTEDYHWTVGAGTVVSDPLYEETGLGSYDRLFHLNGELPSDWYTTTGQILFAGNLSVSSTTSPRKKYYWETYTLLGDPSLSPYIGKPEALTTSVPDSLPMGLKILNISSSAFAYAGLSHFDTLWDAGHVSPSGSVYLDIPDVQKDSCLLIITRHNGIPFVKTLYFIEPDTAWISINDVAVSDESGNNNDLADYGENISLKISLQNSGKQGADNVYMKISSSSQYLSVIEDSLFVGTVDAKTETISTGFDIKVADNIPDQEIAGIDITLFYNGNSVTQASEISLHAPELMILNCIADDTESGNGNGLAEPGERVKLVFRITNNGSSPCSGNLILSNISEYIDFDATNIVTGTVNPGIVAVVEVFAGISPDTPESSEISFDTEFSCPPYSTVKTLGIIAGTTTEDFELQNFTTFPWINNTEHPWITTDEEAYRNTYSARSGVISHNQESVLSMYVNIPQKDTIRFMYKVSSEYYNDTYGDFLNFSIDDDLLLHKSGDIDWTEMEVPLSKGVHLLKWVYKKDGSVNALNDCAYIDLVRFPDLAFIETAIDLNKISSPESGKSYDEEILTVELTNLGRDILNTLSMAYTLNESTPVSETFNFSDFNPGDTISLSFDQTIDMTQDGTYNIAVYLTYPENYFSTDTLRKTIVVTEITDIVIGDKSFIIAPNPVNESVRIISNINSEDNYFLIYSYSGALLYEKHIGYISKGEEILLIPGMLSTGSYILEIQTENKKYLYKIVKL